MSFVRSAGLSLDVHMDPRTALLLVYTYEHSCSAVRGRAHQFFATSGIDMRTPYKTPSLGFWPPLNCFRLPREGQGTSPAGGRGLRVELQQHGRSCRPSTLAPETITAQKASS